MDVILQGGPFDGAEFYIRIEGERAPFIPQQFVFNGAAYAPVASGVETASEATGFNFASYSLIAVTADSAIYKHEPE